MAESSEMRGFVFAVIFIVTFSVLVSTIPSGLQGPEETPNDLVPVDPNLLSGFSEQVNYTRAAFTNYEYEYPSELGGREYIATDGTTFISIGAKRYFWVFWFGAMDACRFYADGDDRGTSLQLTEITADATDGSVSYSMRFIITGASAGSLVCWWNTTEYANATLAWGSDELYLIHGVGFDSSIIDTGSLLFSLLFFQLPNVPTLVNVFLALPIWACIGYLVWYFLKESLPFV